MTDKLLTEVSKYVSFKERERENEKSKKRLKEMNYLKRVKENMGKQEKHRMRNRECKQK